MRSRAPWDGGGSGPLHGASSTALLPVVTQWPPPLGRLPGSPMPSWLIRAAPGRGPLGTSLGLGAYLNVGSPRAGAVTGRVL